MENSIKKSLAARANYDRPPPPAHLSEEMKAFWLVVFKTLRLQPFQVHMLQKAAEAFDRAESARKILEQQGLTFVDRYGQPRARPEAQIEVLNRAQFQKLLKDCGVFDCFFIHERKPRD